MKKVLLRILSIWFSFVFLMVFLIIFPFHLIFLFFKIKPLHDASHFLNKIWGFLIMATSGIFIKSIGKKKLKRGQVYLFAPNHTSYLDIPICNVSIPVTFRFIGKAELNKLPMFGYMFKRLHISVKRESITDSYRSFNRAKEKLEEGTSVLFFPEGTIPDKKKVTLKKFKDGAFRVAIEKQVPIVPVTIIGGDKAMPDDGKLFFYPGVIRVYYHDPIETKGMEISQANELKDKVFDIILEKLKTENDLRPDILKKGGAE